jgi:hypothetical protein
LIAASAIKAPDNTIKSFHILASRTVLTSSLLDRRSG